MATGDPLDELYEASFDAFVATRDRLAAELAQQGRKDEGQALKKVRRPSVSAWATNQVVRHGRKAVDAFLETSDRLRRGQDALLEGRSDQAAYQSAVDELRRATAALTKNAGEVLARAGRDGRALVDGVVSNARAAALSVEGRQELLEARLSADLEAGGDGLFGLGGLGRAGSTAAARPARPAARAPHETKADAKGDAKADAKAEKQERDEHARVVVAARQEAATARDVAARAEAAARAARAKRDEAQSSLREAESRVAKLRQTLRDAETALGDAETHLARVNAEAKATGRRLDAVEKR